MKVLIISSTVSDSISVGKIATQLESNLLQKNIESKVMFFCNGKRTENHLLVVSKIITHLHCIIAERTNYLINNSFIQVHNIKKFIKKYNPDIIHIIQPLPLYIDNAELFKMLDKMQIPCVYSMIDENPYLGNCDNAYSCTQFIEGCDKCNAQNIKVNIEDYKGKWNKQSCRRLAKMKNIAYNSIDNICFIAPEWVVKRADQSHLLKDKKKYIVDEYINTKELYYPRQINNEIVQKYKIDLNKIIILNIAKYSNIRKGVKCFIELAKRMENDDRYLFINIGYDGNNISLPKNYLAIPFEADQERLACFYSLADLYMITSLSDTMPNACLEAMACGTPICGFNITGIPYIAEEPIGQFVAPNSVEELERIVLKTEKKQQNVSKMCREYAVNRFSTDVCVDRIIQIYGEMIKNNYIK